MYDIRGLIFCVGCVFVVYAAPQDSRNFLPQQDVGNDPTISTTHGYLRGQWLTSTHGRRFAAFKGVPYAAPPVGDLRFEPPREASAWNGTRDARKHGPQCPQTLFLTDISFGEEDCLYLNIYTPERNSSTEVFPVMFSVHGGSWALGSGDMDNYLYGPDRFMDEDVIIVTINYRLGVLGFLYLENTIPGNMGLKDQIMALKWIHANAKYFGGDSNRIVVMGNSAGAAAVEYMTMNAKTRKLISGVIAQSGSVLSSWAWTKPETLAERGHRLAGLLKCPNIRSPGSVLRCLKKMHFKQLIRYQLLSNWSPLQLPYGVSFNPTSEPIGTPDAFIEGCPMSDLARMKPDSQKFVPYMTGYMSSESELLRRVDVGNFDLVLQRIFSRTLRLPKTATDVRNFRSKPYSTIPGETFVDKYLTDHEFKGPIIESSRYHARAGADVYTYHFTFNGKNNFGRILFDGNSTSHMDEMLYQFEGRGFFGSLPPIQEPSPEATVSSHLIRMWTNFAKTGNPTPTIKSDDEIKWPRGPSQLLVIDEQLSISKPEFKRAWRNFIDLQCIQ